MPSWEGERLYNSDNSAKSKLALKQFLQEIRSTQPTKCLMAEKLSLMLLHTGLLVKAHCSLFHCTRVFNNNFSSNI